MIKNGYPKFLVVACCLVFTILNLQSQSLLPDSQLVFKYIDKSQYFEQINIDSATWYADEALRISKENSSVRVQCRAILRMAILSQNTSDYKKAAQYYKEGIALAEKLNDKQLRTQGYNGMGNLFGIQKQYPQAAEFFDKALVISKEIKDTRKVAVILMNLANIEYAIAYNTNDYRKANAAYKDAYDWALRAQDTGQQISCLGNWGMSYSDEGKFDLSIEKLNQAIALAKTVNHKSDLVFLYHYLGRAYGFMKQYNKSLEAFSTSLNLAYEFKDVDYESENYYCMAESNYEMGNYKAAYDLFEKYKRTEDTISSKEITEELNAIKIKYDTEKKQQEIELLKANANKDKIVKVSLLIGAVMLLLLAFLMFNRYRLKSKTNKLLEHQNEIISEKNKDISDSINYAKKIQEAILPSHDDISAVFPSHFVVSLPKDVVSGDFYWFSHHDQYKLFVVADCTGHGVPGAFMSMIGNTLLNNIVVERKILRPDLILNELRKEIIKSLKQGETSANKDGMDLSLICLNTDTNVLQLACANNPVWIVKNNGQMLEIKPDKQPIGFSSVNPVDFSLNEIQLEEGDTIYQFTDGFADQFGGDKGKKFKYNQLKEALVRIHQLPMDQQADRLKQLFYNWKGNLEQIDDVLVSGIKV